MISKSLKFSIIIASYNEEKDIRSAIEGVLALNYPNKEIIVVDDSTDNTKQIIKEYSDRGVRLLDGPRRGCCEAMNFAIQESSGEVFVAIDSDVVAPPDFLDKLAEKYNKGADFVILNSKVQNMKSIYSRFSEFQHQFTHKNRTDMHYSEGFSCRRNLALRVGSFDVGNYPVKFCRDWTLGKKMSEAGYKKIYDPSIFVYHIQPDNISEFWNERKERGVFSAFQQYFLDKKSLPKLFFKFLIKDVLIFMKFGLLFPSFWYAYNLSKYSRHQLTDFFPLWFSYFLQELARVFGEWEGFLINIKSSK